MPEWIISLLVKQVVVPVLVDVINDEVVRLQAKEKASGSPESVLVESLDHILDGLRGWKN